MIGCMRETSKAFITQQVTGAVGIYMLCDIAGEDGTYLCMGFCFFSHGMPRCRFLIILLFVWLRMC